MNSLFKLDSEIVQAMESFGSAQKNTISARNFNDSLSVLIKRYQSLIEAFNKMGSNDLQKLADRIYATKNNIPNKAEGKACQIYAEIVAAIKDSKGTRFAFDGIHKTSKAILEVLLNFARNSKTVLGGDSITIANAKLSHLSAVGFMEKAEQYLDYQVSMLVTITNELVTRNNGVCELAPVPPYRYKFLEDFKQGFIDMYNSMANGKHRSFLSNYKKLKQSTNDIFVGNKLCGSNLDYLSDKTKIELDNQLFGTWSLNPFKWLGEVWNMRRHNKYVKMAAEKEELMAHVALLQMELSEKDPNSKEYAKAVKVIDSYNQMIAELDQKLNEYYNEN